MKKMLIALMALFFASNALAYTIAIQNQTNGQISARIFYTGEGVCAQDNKLLEAGRNWRKSTGICCSRYVTFQATSGTAQGKSVTQSIEGCKDFTIRVKMTANGNLIAVLD